MIITLGCKVNQYESAGFAAELERRGCTYAGEGEAADLIIINTCAVTGKGGVQSRNAVRRAARANPQAAIVITGCYAQLDAQQCSKIKELQGRRVIWAGNNQKGRLVSMIFNGGKPELPSLAQMRKKVEEKPLVVQKFHGRTRAYLKIQDGCNAYCTYCIVPYTRGPSRSVPMAAVLEQAELLAANGHREMVITGIHVGNYGQDLGGGVNLVSLLEKLCEQSPAVRFRLSSIEPTEIGSELLELMLAKENFVNHLHIPLQSGSTEILEKMGRKYAAKDFEEIITRCHKKIPHLCIGLDVMVGFPGEDEGLFRQTEQLLTRLPYTYLHVFPYSVRPGTKAASFAGQVAKKIKSKRLAALTALSERKKLAFYEQNLGSSRPVLVEKTRDSRGRLKGFTDNYIPVLMTGSDALVNTVKNVRLSRLAGGEVFGEIL
ncbi:MAG: tRNA (N(6)-L-threonylcarbamoyladenosine(37)-C(2))-methylthiotransferase MtaB [Deltaproteobacteria bacterium]|nr:MAG: tRNA (N(6)-L-threonylcarbamoyladenosine(37)-C(2))-methylthiotransferase MtaB [Deltaproteobacteria bacterium]